MLDCGAMKRIAMVGRILIVLALLSSLGCKKAEGSDQGEPSASSTSAARPEDRAPVATAPRVSATSTPRPATLCANLTQWSLEKRYAVDCESALKKGCEQNSLGVLMAGVIRTTDNEKLSADMKKKVMREAMASVAQKLGDEVGADRAALENAPSRPEEAEIKKGLLKDYDDFRALAASWKKHA